MPAAAKSKGKGKRRRTTAGRVAPTSDPAPPGSPRSDALQATARSRGLVVARRPDLAGAGFFPARPVRWGCGSYTSSAVGPLRRHTLSRRLLGGAGALHAPLSAVDATPTLTVPHGLCGFPLTPAPWWGRPFALTRLSPTIGTPPRRSRHRNSRSTAADVRFRIAEKTAQKRSPPTAPRVACWHDALRCGRRQTVLTGAVAPIQAVSRRL
jgi:hypothetical protein